MVNSSLYSLYHLNMLLQSKLDLANTSGELFATILANSKATLLTVDLPHVQLITENADISI